ncbi:MAG: radical SAM protein [Candidatus Eisenbacteria bacterium]
MRRKPSRAGPSGLPGLSGVLIYPNVRKVAFASLGFLKVFEMFKQRLGLADLSYLPEGRGDSVVSRKQGLLLGLASQAEVRSFDIAAFSVAYENDFVHIPELLEAAGIPPLASERNAVFPLVVCGGFTMSSNPLPVADFIDAAVVGEAEVVVDRLLEAAECARASAGSRADLLKEISEIEGVYVPSLGQQVVRRVWTETGRIAAEPVRQEVSHFGQMFLVEVGRGCGRGCRFCAAGNLYRPVRMRSRETVLERCADHAKVGLVGTAVGDHPDIVAIVEWLEGEGRRVGISSLRADQVTAHIAGMLAACGVRTIAIAPETGSDRLRRRIGKGITRQQIFDAVSYLSAAGIRTIKLYFMIGLPGETDEDVEAIVSLVSELRCIRGKSKLAVAVGPFVPKPHTALQWAAFAERKVLRGRFKILSKIRRFTGCSLKLGSIDEAWTEAILARGDRSLSAFLLEAAVTQRSLRAVLKQSEVPDPHLPLDVRKPLPWDFIDSGVSKKRLLDEYAS